MIKRAKAIGKAFLGVKSDDEYRKFELEKYLDSEIVEPVKAMLLEKTYSKFMFDSLYERIRRPLVMIWVDFKSADHDSDSDSDEPLKSPKSDSLKSRSASSVATMLGSD